MGEWGITQEYYQIAPASLSDTFNALKPHPTMMFFFAHHEVPEPPNAPVIHWGLRKFGFAPEAFVLLDKTDLYDPYDALVGT